MFAVLTFKASLTITGVTRHAIDTGREVLARLTGAVVYIERTGRPREPSHAFTREARHPINALTTVLTRGAFTIIDVHLALVAVVPRCTRTLICVRRRVIRAPSAVLARRPVVDVSAEGHVSLRRLPSHGLSLRVADQGFMLPNPRASRLGVA